MPPWPGRPCKYFLDMSTKAQFRQKKVNKLDFIKIKSSDDTVKRMKRQAKEWEKIFATYISLI